MKTILLLLCFGFYSITVHARVASLPLNSAWYSKETCLSQYSLNTPAKKNALRVATWNIRWFPDGVPGRAPDSQKSTDVEWLACEMASLQVDMFALQELKTTARSLASVEQLKSSLKKLTSADWELVTDNCASDVKQHMAFLYRTDTVDVLRTESIYSIDPTDDVNEAGCDGNLRPGLGLALKWKNKSYYFVNIHLDSGRTSRDFEHRTQAWTKIEEWLSLKNQAYRNRLIVLGDFNVMGQDDVSPQTSEAETNMLQQRWNALVPRIQLLTPQIQCSHYYNGRVALMDRIAVSDAIVQEKNPKVTIAGYCAELSCVPYNVERLAAYLHLSDHCPAIVEF